jgi:hypothetical protein
MSVDQGKATASSVTYETPASRRYGYLLLVFLLSTFWVHILSVHLPLGAFLALFRKVIHNWKLRFALAATGAITGYFLFGAYFGVDERGKISAGFNLPAVWRVDPLKDSYHLGKVAWGAPAAEQDYVGKRFRVESISKSGQTVGFPAEQSTVSGETEARRMWMMFETSTRPHAVRVYALLPGSVRAGRACHRGFLHGRDDLEWIPD